MSTIRIQTPPRAPAGKGFTPLIGFRTMVVDADTGEQIPGFIKRIVFTSAIDDLPHAEIELMAAEANVEVGADEITQVITCCKCGAKNKVVPR